MATNYGYYTSLMPALSTAGKLQQNRQNSELKNLQLLRQIESVKANEIAQRDAIQKQFDAIENETEKLLQTKITAADGKSQYGFTRPKDNDDFYDWWENNSGWNDIQNIIREAGSIRNARLYYNLDTYIGNYRNNLANNPISKRLDAVRPDLQRYLLSANDSESSSLITEGARSRFNSFVKGETDNFTFKGIRSDYLPLDDKKRNAIYGDITFGTNITLDDIIGVNEFAIKTDILNDKGVPIEQHQQFRQSIGYEEMKHFVQRELGYDNLGGVDAFGGKPYFGTKKIETSMGTEILNSLKAMDAAGVTDLRELQNLLTQGKDIEVDGRKVTVDNLQDLYSLYNDGVIRDNFERLGGVGDSAPDIVNQTKILGIDIDPRKNRQIIVGNEIFTNPNARAGLAEVMFGQDSDGVTNYDARTGLVDNVQINTGLIFDDTGKQIESFKDEVFFNAGSLTSLTERPFSEEKEVVNNLKLDGFFTAVEISGIDNNNKRFSRLLTQTKNPEDINKILREYKKSPQIKHVVVAQLTDQDNLFDETGLRDLLYAKLDLSNTQTQVRLNEVFPQEDINDVKTQTLTADVQRKLAGRRKVNQQNIKNRVINLFGASTEKEMDEIANAYEKQLGTGMVMSNIPISKINASIPLVFADLYVNSIQEREYPTQMPDGTVVRNSSEYMAVKTRLLKEDLYKTGANGMVDAIKKGPSAYDEWSKTNLSKKEYGSVKKYRKDLLKYFNTK